MVSTKAKYSKLKPVGTEGNLFSYHLKILVEEGLIELKTGHYYLTAKGKQHVDRISFTTLHTRVQPKIVTLIVLKEKDKYLLYERKRMPFIEHVGFPYGKIHLEERILEAADRELLEKTGLRANLKHRGDVYLTVHDETELISHMLCHVFSGSKITGALKGECFWSPIESIPKNKLIPGVAQIEKLLKENKSNLFFAEYFLNI
jgi:ADP-ribose pyrophosphatase YjhB (NUDIX family)